MAAPSFIRAVAGLTDASLTSASFGAPNLPINTIVLIQILQDGSTSEQLRLRLGNFNWAALDGTTSSATSIGSPRWAAHPRLFSISGLRGRAQPRDHFQRHEQHERRISTSVRMPSPMSPPVPLSPPSSRTSAADDLYANGAGTGTTISDTGVTTSGPRPPRPPARRSGRRHRHRRLRRRPGRRPLPSSRSLGDGRGRAVAGMHPGTTLYATTTTGNVLYGDAGAFGALAWGQSFTTSVAATLMSASVNVAKVASPTDNVVIEI